MGDEDGSGDISFDELRSIFKNPLALEVFENLQVDLTYFLEIMEMFYPDAEEEVQLPIPLIMDRILACRGDRPTTVKDIVDWHAYTRFAVRKAISQQEAATDKLLEMVSGIPSFNQSLRSVGDISSTQDVA